MVMDCFLILKIKLLFVPQLFYKEIFLPFGIQSTQMHINYWKEQDFVNFENFINKINKKVITLDYIINISNPSIFQSVVNYM